MRTTDSDLGEIGLVVPTEGSSHDAVAGVTAARDAQCTPAHAMRIRDCSLCIATFEQEGEPGAPAGQCARWSGQPESSLAVPLRYQHRTVGLLALHAQRAAHYTATHHLICQHIASHLTRHLKRHEVRQRISMTFGKDLVLVGGSDSLLRLDEFIEKASLASHPALLLGEFGLEQHFVAYALHFAGRSNRPFLEVNCATLDQGGLCCLPRRLRQLEGGTVFFQGIDELDSKLQRELSQLIEEEIEVPRRPGSSVGPPLRLVASAGANFNHNSDRDSAYRPLIARFDYLPLCLVPLRERREDIGPLIDHFLRKHAGGRSLELTPAAREAFELYHWPNNISELERVIARLSILSDHPAIDIRDLEIHAPWLAAGRNKPVRSSTLESISESEERASISRTGTGLDARISALARGLIKAEFKLIRAFHPSLQNALEYLSRNLHETITLQELARHAALSASHLAFLFQKTLGVNFKLFLAVLRIEEAKQLLVEQPHLRITEISYQVGFGDLRHFERTFKRLVSRTPREYRSLVLGDALPPDSEA